MFTKVGSPRILALLQSSMGKTLQNTPEDCSGFETGNIFQITSCNTLILPQIEKIFVFLDIFCPAFLLVVALAVNLASSIY